LKFCSLIGLKFVS